MTPLQLSWNRSILPFDIAISDDKNSNTFRSDVITASANFSTNILNIRPQTQFNFGRPRLPDDECDSYDMENLYRIYSRHQLSDDDLASILMHPDAGGRGHLDDHNPSWLHRQQWSAGSPVRDKAKPLPVEDIQLAPQFFYLNAAKHIVSSLEISCRMGGMIARRLSLRTRRLNGSDCNIRVQIGVTSSRYLLLLTSPSLNPEQEGIVLFILELLLR